MGKFSLTNAYVYILLLTTVSFLFALWAFIVMFKASIPELGLYHYGKKVIAFQLCLIFLRFQVRVKCMLYTCLTVLMIIICALYAVMYSNVYNIVSMMHVYCLNAGNSNLYTIINKFREEIFHFAIK